MTLFADCVYKSRSVKPLRDYQHTEICSSGQENQNEAFDNYRSARGINLIAQEGGELVESGKRTFEIVDSVPHAAAAHGITPSQLNINREQ